MHVVGRAAAQGWTPLALAGRRSAIAPGRRKLPRCGAGSRLAWTARRARLGQAGYALLDVALSLADSGCTSFPHQLEPDTRETTVFVGDGSVLVEKVAGLMCLLGRARLGFFIPHLQQSRAPPC